MRTRARYISLLRALLRREGLSLRSGTTSCILERVAELELSADLKREVRPLLRMFQALNREIQRADKAVESIVRKDVTVKRLCSVPGVRPITAASFVATLDTAARFAGPHQVQAYLELVPSEHSSGNTQRKGRITKTGNRRTRSLLVEAAWAVWHRSKRTEAAPLRAWTARVTTRRGPRIAVVALARKLAGVFFALMRDGTVFQPERLGSTP